MKISILVILITLVNAFHQGTLSAQDSEKLSNSIVFYKIDNRALVLVNGVIIYDSGVIDDAPELDIEVDLNAYLIKEENEVTIKLINSKCPNCFSNPWGVHYDIYQNGESVDYIYESGDGDLAGGEVYSETIYW